MSGTVRQIVDENDQVIAHKSKDEIDFTREIYRVAALWVASTDGKQVLLAQRGTQTTNGPGLWGPAVAGTVEQGETYETNIYKEAMEEIGLQGVSFTVGPKQFYDGERRYFCQWYMVSVNPTTTLVPDPEEVGDVKWVLVQDLLADVIARPEKYLSQFRMTVEILSHHNEKIAKENV